HRVAAIGVDWANSANLLPLDAPSHQATIKNSALVDRQDDTIVKGSPAESAQEEGNTEQPGQAKPSHKGDGQREAHQRRRGGAKEKKGGNRVLGETQYEGSPACVADSLRVLNNIVPGRTYAVGLHHGAPRLNTRSRPRLNPGCAHENRHKDTASNIILK